jgi:hypothetical protein
MALVFADRVKVRSRTTGTGAFILENTVDGFQSFDAVGDGNETFYSIVDVAGNWEIGRGTFFITIDNTNPLPLTVKNLSRDTIVSSSNNNQLVDFLVGSKNVYVTIPSTLVAPLLGIETDPVFSAATLITADLKGSVFADDSTLLVDGTSGSIPWSVISGAPTFSSSDTLDDVSSRGASTANNITLSGVLSLEQIQETYNIINAANGLTVHDCSSGQIFLHTNVASNIQVNLTNLNLSTSKATNITCVIVQGLTGYTINQIQIAGAAQTINWLNNSQPSGTVGNIDIFTFSILNNASTYTVIGSASTFGPSP